MFSPHTSALFHLIPKDAKLRDIIRKFLVPEQQVKTGVTLNLIFNTEIVFCRLCKVMTHSCIAGRWVAKVSGEWFNVRWENFLNGIGRLIVKKGGTP